MKRIIVRFISEAAARRPEVPISGRNLDPRSKPAFETSAHKGIWFSCLPLWERAIAGKFKIIKTTKSPAQWVKQSFKLTDPKDFKTKSLPAINKTKVLKYAKLMKTGKVDVPPVLFAKDKAGKSFFIDGNHRLMAAFMAGIPEIPCYQFQLEQLLRATFIDEDGVKTRIARDGRYEDED